MDHVGQLDRHQRVGEVDAQARHARYRNALVDGAVARVDRRPMEPRARRRVALTRDNDIDKGGGVPSESEQFRPGLVGEQRALASREHCRQELPFVRKLGVTRRVNTPVAPEESAPRDAFAHRATTQSEG